jgi:hypothetical protein
VASTSSMVRGTAESRRLHLSLRRRVVEDRRVRPARNDGGIARSVGSGALDGLLDRGFDRVLVNPAMGGPHPREVPVARDSSRLDDDLALVVGLDLTERIEELRRVLDPKAEETVEADAWVMELEGLERLDPPRDRN